MIESRSLDYYSSGSIGWLVPSDSSSGLRRCVSAAGHNKRVATREVVRKVPALNQQNIRIK